MKHVIKRDGTIVPYEIEKIQAAVFKAAYLGQINNEYIGTYHSDPVKSNFLANTIARQVDTIIKTKQNNIDIEEIQNIVVSQLNHISKYVGKSYLEYKTKKQLNR